MSESVKKELKALYVLFWVLNIILIICDIFIVVWGCIYYTFIVQKPFIIALIPVTGFLLITAFATWLINAMISYRMNQLLNKLKEK